MSLEAPQTQTNWKHILIAAVITAALTFFVTISSGYILNSLQTHEARLVYVIDDVTFFEGDNGNYAIYNVKVANTGNKDVESVVCEISLPKMTINQKKVKIEPSIPYTESMTNDSYRIELPTLNPSEQYTVSLFSTNSNDVLSTPKVSLRGKGISGLQVRTVSSASENDVGSLLLFAIVMALLMGSIISIVLRITKTFGGIDLTDSDNQKEVLAYICEINGLDQDAAYYRSFNGDVTYWSESDRITQMAIKDPSSELTSKRKEVLENLIDYKNSIHPRSKSIIFFDLAKIAYAQGKLDEVDSYLDKAKKLSNQIIEKRLAIDPIIKT